MLHLLLLPLHGVGEKEMTAMSTLLCVGYKQRGDEGEEEGQQWRGDSSSYPIPPHRHPYKYRISPT